MHPEHPSATLGVVKAEISEDIQQSMGFGDTNDRVVLHLTSEKQLLL